MKRFIRRLLERVFEETGIKADVNQYSEMATPLVLFVFAAVALYFAVSYWRSYKNWEGEGEAPKLILVSVGTLTLLGIGLTLFGLSYLI